MNEISFESFQNCIRGLVLPVSVSLEKQFRVQQILKFWMHFGLNYVKV